MGRWIGAAEAGSIVAHRTTQASPAAIACSPHAWHSAGMNVAVCAAAVGIASPDAMTDGPVPAAKARSNKASMRR